MLNAKVVAKKHDLEEVASIQVRVGGLYETTLSELDKASNAYEAALEADPANILAMRGLERIYAAQGNWNEMVKILEQQLDVVPTERERNRGFDETRFHLRGAVPQA